MPPATATSRSPARTACSTIPAERRPEAQTLFTVSDGTSRGMPPLICAWREGIWPWPAWSTWPKTTCCTSSGLTSARSSAASIVVPPRSVASSEEKAPPSLPKGVRAAPRMTVFFAMVPCVGSSYQNHTRAFPALPLDLRAVMASIRITALRGAPEETAADTRVVGLFEGEELADPRLQALVELGEAKPGFRKLAVTHEEAPGGGQRRVLIAGLGSRDEFDPERARVIAAEAAAKAKELGAVSLSWAAPEGDGVPGALVEGTVLRLYAFDRYKSKKEEEDGDRAAIESLEIAGDTEEIEPQLERSRLAAEAANRARDLQNLPANVATPTFLAERAAEIAAQHESLEVELLDREAIVARGMGAFAAVAQGSHQEPRLIVLRYRGGDGPHVGFVGKAVTFDTGGISIKPAAKMHEMKFDMSGGAAV